MGRKQLSFAVKFELSQYKLILVSQQGKLKSIGFIIVW